MAEHESKTLIEHLKSGRKVELPPRKPGNFGTTESRPTKPSQPADKERG
ncbi:MAG TPA: hypothetical protein VHV29_02575 [Terriglobales bacterium]|jgi:hypothetical protein|nr:hypothetical protein [Terriglobales bacterium]